MPLGGEEPVGHRQSVSLSGSASPIRHRAIGVLSISLSVLPPSPRSCLSVLLVFLRPFFVDALFIHSQKTRRIWNISGEAQSLLNAALPLRAGPPPISYLSDCFPFFLLLHMRVAGISR